MARPKQIKKEDLGEFGKNVVDSLLNKSKPHKEEETHEQMRCKIDILIGNGLPYKLIDTYTINTNNIRKTIDDIMLKYGKYVQFRITNLYDEKIVAKSFFNSGIGNKEKDDKEHFGRQIDIVRKIQKMRDEGKKLDEVLPKFSHLAGHTYITKVYNSTEEQMQQFFKDAYGNQTLSKSLSEKIIIEDSNINKGNINIEKEDENICQIETPETPKEEDI